MLGIAIGVAILLGLGLLIGRLRPPRDFDPEWRRRAERETRAGR